MHSEGNGGVHHVSPNQESKGREGTASIGVDHDSGMEGEFVVCEHIEDIERERSPARVKAPPLKRRAVIRLESAETQDYGSELQLFEERDDEEELSFIPSAVCEP